MVVKRSLVPTLSSSPLAALGRLDVLTRRLRGVLATDHDANPAWVGEAEALVTEAGMIAAAMASPEAGDVGVVVKVTDRTEVMADPAYIDGLAGKLQRMLSLYALADGEPDPPMTDPTPANRGDRTTAPTS